MYNAYILCSVYFVFVMIILTIIVVVIYLNIFYIKCFIILIDIVVQYEEIFYSFDMIQFHCVVYCIIFV